MINLISRLFTCNRKEVNYLLILYLLHPGAAYQCRTHFTFQCARISFFHLAFSFAFFINLENTLSVSEGGDVASGVLLSHGLAGHALNNHVSHNSHHSGTSVVQLNIELAGLLGGVLDVLSEVANTVISRVVRGRHPGELDKSEEKEDLEKSGSGDGTDSVNSGGNIRELEVVGRAQVSIEDDVVVVDDGSNNGSHGNTSVLALDGTTTLERLGLVIQPSERIINTERGGGTELELVDVQGGVETGLLRCREAYLSSHKINEAL